MCFLHLFDYISCVSLRDLFIFFSLKVSIVFIKLNLRSFCSASATLGYPELTVVEYLGFGVAILPWLLLIVFLC